MSGHLLRWIDGEREVLEHKGKVVGVAECYVRKGQCPLGGPVSGGRFVGEKGLQRGLWVQLAVCHHPLSRYHLEKHQSSSDSCHLHDYDVKLDHSPRSRPLH